MDFDLTEELLAIKGMARDFARKEIAPSAAEDDKAHRFPRDLIAKMGELGLLGCPIPEEYGGNGAGYLAHTLVVEQVAGASSALRIPFNSLTMGPAVTIFRHGSEYLKRRYISKLVRGEMIGSFCITEPNSGSDTASMTTTATEDGDFYLLNGTKTWATYSTVADVMLVYCYTDRSKKYKGMSALIIDAGSEGIAAADLDKMGVHAAPTGEVTFEKVRVPKANILGQPGEGFKILMDTLNGTRLTTAAGAIGLAQACLDAAVEYADQREQFGQKINRYQMIQEKVANLAIEVEAARLLTYKAAWQKDQGYTDNTVETAMAKALAADVAVRASDSAMLIFGAYGYSTEYPIERYYRDAKLYQIVEGSTNILRTIIAGDVLGFKKRSKQAVS